MSKSFTTICLSRLPLPLILLLLSIATSEASEVIGRVDGLDAGGFDKGHVIVGWTCQQGDARSSAVHIYLDKKASKGGTFFKAVVANKVSESDVGAACGTAGTNYRFEVPVSNAEALAYGGKEIYAYGISTIGTGNLILDQGRGDFMVPMGVYGEISYVNFEFNDGKGGQIKGWTCQAGNEDALDVFVYMGGTATGGGEYFDLAWSGRQTRNPTAEAVCAEPSSGTYRYYGFNVLLSRFERKRFQGKSIYVYAGDFFKKPRTLLAKSGDYTVPDV